jgi:hypothetical protein
MLPPGRGDPILLEKKDWFIPKKDRKKRSYTELFPGPCSGCHDDRHNVAHCPRRLLRPDEFPLADRRRQLEFEFITFVWELPKYYRYTTKLTPDSYLSYLLKARRDTMERYRTQFADFFSHRTGSSWSYEPIFSFTFATAREVLPFWASLVDREYNRFFLQRIMIGITYEAPMFNTLFPFSYRLSSGKSREEKQKAYLLAGKKHIERGIEAICPENAFRIIHDNFIVKEPSKDRLINNMTWANAHEIRATHSLPQWQRFKHQLERTFHCIADLTEFSSETITSTRKAMTFLPSCSEVRWAMRMFRSGVKESIRYL